MLITKHDIAKWRKDAKGYGIKAIIPFYKKDTMLIDYIYVLPNDDSQRIKDHVKDFQYGEVEIYDTIYI